MGTRFEAVAPPTVEVPMVEAEAVRQMRELAGRGWGAKKIARERSFEPHARVVDPAHLEGLWRKPSENVVPLAQPLAALGRTLDDYAAVIGGAA